jgi:site-specific DNA-methyltransferase (adenine-specific)
MTKQQASIHSVEISSLNIDRGIRRLNQFGVDAIASKIDKSGYLDSFPIMVSADMTVIDGHHRVASCKKLGINAIPAMIKDVSGNEALQLAFQANEASETAVPMTFVDYAEFIWRHDGTQQEVADVLGWSVSKVKNYSALAAIDDEAWIVIVTVFDEFAKPRASDAVTEKVTDVTFSENLLRPIINLTQEQQLQLVQDLSAGTISKNRFKFLANQYAQQNKDKKALQEALPHISEELLAEGIAEIETGNYDLEKLIETLAAKHKKETSIELLHGDFYELGKTVRNIDLIITDPPYNVAHDNEHIYEGRKNVSKDFGEWDKLDHETFISQFTRWAEMFSSMLNEDGAGYVFTSDRYISTLREALEQAGLRYRATLVLHKTNPGTSPTKTNFISSIEYIVYFTKGNPVFNWMGDAEMHNFIESPICAGNERIKDSRNDTLHPTQKPEKVIRHLMEISSVKGSTVFDGFMGVGTVAAVAKDLDRRFIGIEQDEKYYKAACCRIK